MGKDNAISKKIIFVDDEPHILRGLRRATYELADDWEIEFANSGKEALTILERTAYDAIVSDMRMPEMNGAELLEEVSRLYPRMVRIVLSGQSDKELILKSVMPTHQYLSKPCNIQELVSIVNESIAVRDLLSNSRLQEIVSKISTVPSLPTLYTQIENEMNSPDFKLARIGNIICQDAGMTAKILQLVNSSFFGMATRITNPAQAAKMLGADIVRGLILTAHVFSKFEHIPVKCLSIEAFSQHSLCVATLARKIVESKGLGKEALSDAFVGGLLHDIGKLIMAQNFASDFDAANEYAKKHEIPFYAAEQEILGSSHAEVGGYLVGLWGLPHSIVKTLMFHHNPSQLHQTEFTTLTAVYVANQIVNGDTCDPIYLTDMGITEEETAWRTLLSENTEQGV